MQFTRLIFIALFIICLVTQETFCQQPEIVLPVGHDNNSWEGLVIDHGKKILTTGRNETILWDTRSGKIIHRFEGYAHDRNEQVVILADDKQTISIWDLSTLKIVSTCRPLNEEMQDITLSPDHKELVIIYPDDIVFYNLVQKKIRLKLPLHVADEYGSSAVFSKKGDFVFLSNNINTQYIISAASGKVLWSGEVSGTENMVQYYPGLNQVLLVEKDNVSVINGATGKFIFRKSLSSENKEGINWQKEDVFSLSIDGRFLSVMENNSIEIWNIRDNKKIRTTGFINSHVQFAGASVFVMDSLNKLVEWDLVSGNAKKTFDFKYPFLKADSNVIDESVEVRAEPGYYVFENQNRILLTQTVNADSISGQVFDLASGKMLYELFYATGYTPVDVAMKGNLYFFGEDIYNTHYVGAPISSSWDARSHRVVHYEGLSSSIQNYYISHDGNTIRIAEKLWDFDKLKAFQIDSLEEDYASGDDYEDFADPLNRPGELSVNLFSHWNNKAFSYDKKRLYELVRTVCKKIPASPRINKDYFLLDSSLYYISRQKDSFRIARYYIHKEKVNIDFSAWFQGPIFGFSVNLDKKVVFLLRNNRLAILDSDIQHLHEVALEGKPDRISQVQGGEMIVLSNDSLLSLFDPKLESVVFRTSLDQSRHSQFALTEKSKYLLHLGGYTGSYLQTIDLSTGSSTDTTLIELLENQYPRPNDWNESFLMNLKVFVSRIDSFGRAIYLFGSDISNATDRKKIYLGIYSASNKKFKYFRLPDSRIVPAVILDTKNPDIIFIVREYEIMLDQGQVGITSFDLNKGKIIDEITGPNYYGNLYFNLPDRSLLAFPNGNGIVFFDHNTGKPIADFFPFKENQSLTILTDHYYKITPSVVNQLSWRINNRIVGFEQFDLKFNRPDLVLKALSSHDTALIAAYKQAYLKRLRRQNIDTAFFQNDFSIPDLQLLNRSKLPDSIKNNTVSLTIHATSKVRLDRFNIWVNEVPVFGRNGISLRNLSRKLFDTTVTVTLSTGDNRIESSVTDVNGTESYRDPAFINHPLPANGVDSGKTIFIGLGINNFKNGQMPLSWSIKDIEDLSGFFKANGAECHTFFDERVQRETITTIRKILDSVDVNDKVIIAYSGHGLISSRYDYYLSTYDIDFASPEISGIIYEDLENIFDHIAARKKLLLIDACNSGEIDKEDVQGYTKVTDSSGKRKFRGFGIKESSNKRLGLKSSFELMQELFVNIERGTGTTIISAASGTQLAQEDGRLGNGVFTYCILKALKANKSLRVGELKNLVSDQVEKITGGLQKPTSRNEPREIDWSIWD